MKLSKSLVLPLLSCGLLIGSKTTELTWFAVIYLYGCIFSKNIFLHYYNKDPVVNIMRGCNHKSLQRVKPTEIPFES